MAMHERMMVGGKNGKVNILNQAAMRLSGSSAINSMTVYLSDTDAADEAISDMEDVLYDHRTERTMEIGLRKALGAKPSVIQLQFLIESVMMSLIGIVVGNLVSIVIAHFIDMPFLLNIDAITLAFFFSATVGVIFGWAPARKVSRLNPIDALRSM